MRKWLPALLIVAAYAVSAAVYPRLPDRVPTHWGLSGEPDGWSGPLVGAIGMPTITLAAWLLLLWLPTLDPRKSNIEKFRDSYDGVLLAMVTLLVTLHFAMLGVALGWPVPVTQTALAGIGILFLVLGNALPRARSNFIFGIRTPWTLSSDTVWTRTHRVGGYVLCVAGLVMIASVLAPPPWNLVFVLSSAFGAAGATIVYSYMVWKRETQ